MHKAAVILINYNSAPFTTECVRSVLEKTDPELDYVIAITDNASHADDYTSLKAKLPNDSRVILQRSETNTGFGGGNNAGRSMVKAEYLLFLNNDTQFENDALSQSIAYLQAHPEAGVVTAQNYDQDGNFVPSFDHDKGLRKLLFGRGMLQKSNPSRYPDRRKVHQVPLPVDWVNGAFMCFRAEEFDQIGGFDPSIFLYFEEMDLAHRLRKIGKKCVLLPHARIMHHQGVSIGKSHEIDKEAYISYLHVIRKHRGVAYALLINTYLVLVCLIKPRKWYLLPTLLRGGSKKYSIRHKQ